MSTIVPLLTFPPRTHRDANDTDYSVLINFGAGCWLVLQDLQLRVHLQPYEVVIFLSNELTHSIMAVEGDPYAEERWSISYYQRKVVARACLPVVPRDDHNVMAERAAAARGE